MTGLGRFLRESVSPHGFIKTYEDDNESIDNAYVRRRHGIGLVRQ